MIMICSLLIVCVRKTGRIFVVIVATFVLLQLMVIEKSAELPLCPEAEDFKWNIAESTETTLADVKKTYNMNARWRPSHCRSRLHLAVMVPYRNRPEQLANFLKHMHSYFQHHNYDYVIAVIEQTASAEFNRGMLMNIGFKEINKLYPGYYNCFALHDVDILPMNSTISYICPSGTSVAHLASSMDRFGHKNPYSWYLGGISVINKETFLSVNGFSNLYFGWGGEDDDLAYRLQARNGKIIRYEAKRTMTKMMTHNREKENSQRQTILDAWRTRAAVDGLNSLEYKILETNTKDTFSHLKVDINKQKMIDKFETKYMMTLVPPTVPAQLLTQQDQEEWEQFITEENIVNNVNNGEKKKFVFPSDTTQTPHYQSSKSGTDMPKTSFKKRVPKTGVESQLHNNQLGLHNRQQKSDDKLTFESPAKTLVAPPRHLADKPQTKGKHKPKISQQHKSAEVQHSKKQNFEFPAKSLAAPPAGNGQFEMKQQSKIMKHEISIGAKGNHLNSKPKLMKKQPLEFKDSAKIVAALKSRTGDGATVQKSSENENQTTMTYQERLHKAEDRNHLMWMKFIKFLNKNKLAGPFYKSLKRMKGKKKQN